MTDKCVFVGGLLDSQVVDGHVEERLEDRYDEVEYVSYDSCVPDRSSLMSHMGDVGSSIDDMYGGDDVDVWGFSSGGVLAREAVELEEMVETGEKVGNLVTMNSPYRTPEIAVFLDSLCSSFGTSLDMDHNSPFLGELSREERIEDINYVNAYSVDNPFMSQDELRMPNEPNISNVIVGDTAAGIAAEIIYDTAQTATQLNCLASKTAETAIGTFLKPAETPENLEELSEEARETIEQATEALDQNHEELFTGHIGITFKNETYTEVLEEFR